jgi:hypothetical protein
LRTGDGKQVPGTKLSMERITVGLLCNATGTDLEPLSTIGKAAKPRPFKNWDVRQHVRYYNNSTAWMKEDVSPPPPPTPPHPHAHTHAHHTPARARARRTRGCLQLSIHTICLAQVFSSYFRAFNSKMAAQKRNCLRQTNLRNFFAAPVPPRATKAAPEPMEG